MIPDEQGNMVHAAKIVAILSRHKALDYKISRDRLTKIINANRKNLTGGTIAFQRGSDVAAEEEAVGLRSFVAIIDFENKQQFRLAQILQLYFKKERGNDVFKGTIALSAIPKGLFARLSYFETVEGSKLTYKRKDRLGLIKDVEAVNFISSPNVTEADGRFLLDKLDHQRITSYCEASTALSEDEGEGVDKRQGSASSSSSSSSSSAIEGEVEPQKKKRTQDAGGVDECLYRPHNTGGRNRRGDVDSFTAALFQPDSHEDWEKVETEEGSLHWVRKKKAKSDKSAK